MRYESGFTQNESILLVGKYDANASLAFMIDYQKLTAQKVVHFDCDLVALDDIVITQELYDKALALCEWHQDTTNDDREIEMLLQKLLLIKCPHLLNVNKTIAELEDENDRLHRALQEKDKALMSIKELADEISKKALLTGRSWRAWL